MAAGEIRAGRAYVELSLQGEFSKQLDAAKKKLEDFGKSVTAVGKSLLAIGSAIAAPLAVAVQQFASMGDALNKASQRTGVAVENLSQLKYAAEQSGASFEDLESGLRKMSKAIFEAETGSKTAQASLASIGLTVQDLKGLAPDKQFMKVADALQHVADPGAKAALAMELFGKGGATLLPMLADGSRGIQELSSRATALGLVIGKDDAEAATKFGDTVDDLVKQVRALAFNVGAAVASALQPFAEITINVMTAVINWIKEHRSLVLIVLASAAAILTAGAALVALGVGISAIVAAISGIGAAIGFVAAAAGLLLNPIVLIGAALAALAAYLIYTTDVGQQVIAYLKAKFGELANTASETFGGIADALAAGDITLAAQILWTGLQLAWSQGTFELKKKWIDFKYAFIEAGVFAFYGVLEAWQTVKASLLKYFNNTVTAIADIWDIFSTGFANTWDKIINGVAKGLLYIQSLWDDSFNYDDAAKALDEQQKADQERRDKDQNARFRERTDAAREENKRIDDEKRKRASGLEADKNALLEGAAGANQAEKDELQKRGEDLQKQLDDQRKKAADEKQKKKDDDKPPPFIDPKKFSIDDIESQRNAVASPAKSAGTFNGQAVIGLQSGPTVEYLRRTAIATEEAAKNTRRGLRYR